jgi:integrase
MAQVIQRIWRSGPREVRKVAWGYTLQLGGRQIRKYDTKWTREQAQAALAARILDRDVPKAPAAGKTLAELGAEYLAQKERTKRSVRNDRMAVARFKADFGADTLLSEITAQRIAEWARHRLATPAATHGRPLNAASLNRELAILRHMLRLAEEWGYIDRVPRIRLEREEQGRLRFLTEHEAVRLLAECRKSAEHPVSSCRSPELAAIVTVALNTGMRKGEISGLTWDRVDFARGVLLLERTKSGRRREVPMNRAVDAVLASLRGDRTSGRVFGPLSVRGAFLSAVERAGLVDFKFHDLRHTFASWLVMRGRPLKEVQELLGHQTIAMTMRYAHLSPDRLRDAVAALEDFSTTSAQSAATTPAAFVSPRQN